LRPSASIPAPGTAWQTRPTIKTGFEHWWERWPDAQHWFIATGTRFQGSSCWIRTIRGDVCGGDNLSELAADFGGLPDTLTAITGNGKHLYFQHPGGMVKNSTGKLAYGVDVKADGG